MTRPAHARRTPRGPDASHAHGDARARGAAGNTPPAITRILSVDVGGTKIKALATGNTEPRKAPSGRRFTPKAMVLAVKQLAKGWTYDAVSIGIPSLVGHAGPKSEPGNLGGGWVGFDYAAAFGLPVKVMNDAAMQALGSYEGGRMLFIGLGTGVGAAMIAENAIVPLELGDLPWNRHRESLHDVLGREGLRRFGLAEWRRVVGTALVKLMHAFIADYVVIGGGNAKRLRSLPHGIRRGHNLTAFRGGARLWGVNDVPILTTAPPVAPEAHVALDWRML
jgi:predicted NBD/HSP70 family sugar kinase